MRRKFLSVVLCVCMMLTMAPFAFAEEDGTPTISDGGGSGSSNAVAQIERTRTSYDTLQEAIDDAQTGDTITLQKSISANEIGSKKQLQFNKASMSLTLDLNDNVMTAEAGEAISINAANIDLTVKNGTIKNFADGNYSDGLYAYKESNNLTLKFENVQLESRTQGLAVQGLTSNSNVTILNSKITSSQELGIYYPPKSGTLTITNSEVTGATGVVIKGSNLVVNGSQTIISGTGPNTDPETYYTGATDGSSQLTETGDAIYIESGYNDRDISVTISDGHFTSTHAQAVRMFIKNGEETSVKREVSLIGGTFSSDVSRYLTNDYIQNENGTVEALNENNAVAKINDTYYKTLASAVAAAEPDATVTLLKNTKEKVTVSQNLTVDLGGHTLTGSDLTNGNGKPERVAFTANAGNVTIQNGTVDGRVNAYDAGNLTIAANLTIKNSYNGEGYDCFGIVVWGDATNSKTPKLTVNGKVTLEKGGIAISTNGNDKSNAEITINKGAVVSSNEDGAIYLPSGKLIMNGGTISGPTGIQICAGSANINSEFQLNGGTVIATGDDQRTSKGSGDGLIPDGAAISVVNRGYPNGVPTVAINGGFFSSAKNDAVLAYNWSAGVASNWAEATSHVSITNGYFTSDPTAYVKSTTEAPRYVVDSDTPGYSYMVTNTEPQKAPVIVKDATDTSLNSSITGDTKTKIERVISKANVDGTAEAISDSAKTDIVNAAGVTSDDQNDKTKKITIDVKVTVSATGATTEDNNKISTLTFTATPVATVSVNGEQKATNIPVPNSYLNSKEITVKLPLPSDFTPVQIKHTSSDGSVEYFLSTPKRGAKPFTIEDGCAVFTITKFSTFEVSGTQTYVEPSSGGSISAPTTYAVNVNAATNGAVAADKKTASKGTTVTVTASPSKGYVVDAVKVVDKDGKDVAVTGKDGKYVFTMPASAVTVTGSFKAETPAPAALPFTDVKSGNWFYDAVKYAYEQGLMTGTSATTFAPNGTMNRAMIVTVLYRLEKSPAVTGASKFTDVPAGQWYSDAVAWAAANKIVNGYDETTFGPMNAVTREQMAAILFRYEQVKGLENVTLEENLNRFPDQDKISAYAIPALQWAVGQKIINGNADGTLDPTGTATRAQVAQIFTNLLNK